MSKKLLVLIAEDDPAAARLVKTVVEGLDHVAVVCPDGQHALDMLNANPDAALLVSDLMMPRLDGRALLKAVRESERLKDLPVVILSAYVGPKQISELLEAGAEFVLQKPVHVNELREYIGKALEKGRTKR